MSKLFSKDDFRDNCGFGLIADINGIKSHKIINKSINALRSMTHRGAIGADGKTGDGCGLSVLRGQAAEDDRQDLSAICHA